jgi:hypothetical protein
MGSDDSVTALAGLCASCVHCQRIENSRGSVFFLCRRALEDPQYRRYPPLPVRQCRGYQSEVASRSSK